MGDDAARAGVKRRSRLVHRAPLGVALLALALACVDARPARHVAGYDADSAARFLLEPALIELLAVDTLLEAGYLARHGGRCSVGKPSIAGTVKRIIDAPAPDGSRAVIFTRTTAAGLIEHVELLRHARGRPLAGVTWDVPTGTTVHTRWPPVRGEPVHVTRLRDPDSPLAHGMQWIGRRANGVKCD